MSNSVRILQVFAALDSGGLFNFTIYLYNSMNTE